MTQQLIIKENWQLINGLRLYTRQAVNPSAVKSIVFVSGLSISSYYMLPSMRELSRQYSVYAPDLPGVGKSEKPSHVLNVTELADMLASWLTINQLSDAVLLGNSFGCQIIVDLLARQPAFASAIVLVSPTINPHKRSFTRQFFPFLGDVIHEPMSLIPIAVWDYLRAGIWRSWHTLQYALKDPIEKKLPLIKVPGLIVKGEFDPIVPQDWAEEATRLLPDGSLRVIKMSGHAVNYNSPIELADCVREFLQNEEQVSAGSVSH